MPRRRIAHGVSCRSWTRAGRATRPGFIIGTRGSARRPARAFSRNCAPAGPAPSASSRGRCISNTAGFHVTCPRDRATMPCASAAANSCPASEVPCLARCAAPVVCARRRLQRPISNTGVQKPHCMRVKMPAERQLCSRRQVARRSRAPNRRTSQRSPPASANIRPRSDGRPITMDGVRRPQAPHLASRHGFRSASIPWPDDFREQRRWRTSVLRPSRRLTVQRSIICPEPPMPTRPPPAARWTPRPDVAGSTDPMSLGTDMRQCPMGPPNRRERAARPQPFQACEFWWPNNRCMSNI